MGASLSAHRAPKEVARNASEQADAAQRSDGREPSDVKQLQQCGLEMRLAVQSGKLFHPIVRRLEVIVTLLILALWLPASSHAFLQHYGFIHQIYAHDDHGDSDHDEDSEGPQEHGTDNHPAADGLCLASAGKVQMPTPTFVVLPGWLAVPLVATLMDANVAALHSGLSPPGTAPPEFSPRWQFSFRAALPVRAPSFVS